MSKLQLVNAKTMEKLLLLQAIPKLVPTFRNSLEAATHQIRCYRILLPYHKARMLARPLIREILREIEITIDDYNNHIKADFSY